MNVDAIIVISLDTAEDRRHKMKQWYPSHVPLEFFIVKRMNNPEEGCFVSHQQVLKLAKDKGYNRVLILEDDAYPMKDWNTIVTVTNNALKEVHHVDSDWKFLMLGYLPLSSRDINNKYIHRVKYAFDTHAYIINVNNVNTKVWKEKSIDQFYFCSNDKHVYATNQVLFIQFADSSSMGDSHLLLHDVVPILFNGIDNMTKTSYKMNTLCVTSMIMLIVFLIPITILFFLLSSKLTYIPFIVCISLFFICLVILIITGLVF